MANGDGVFLLSKQLSNYTRLRGVDGNVNLQDERLTLVRPGQKFSIHAGETCLIGFNGGDFLIDLDVVPDLCTISLGLDSHISHIDSEGAGTHTLLPLLQSTFGDRLCHHWDFDRSGGWLSNMRISLGNTRKAEEDYEPYRTCSAKDSGNPAFLFHPPVYVSPE